MIMSAANAGRTDGFPGRAAVALFVPPLPRFGCVFCAGDVLRLTQKAAFYNGFSRWRGGRVAEGGGLLNRYTV
jgi:hypothetical protein